MDNTKVKLTGLWRHEGKSGEPYLLGKISPSSSLLILKNTKKESPSHPDFTAFIVPAEKEAKAEDKAQPREML